MLKKNDQWDLENLQEELDDVRVQAAEANIDSDDDLMARTTMASDSNFRMDIIEELDCTKRDKDREKKEKKGQITKLFDQIKELKKVNTSKICLILMKLGSCPTSRRNKQVDSTNKKIGR